MSRTRRTRRPAFTLTELMVAIGVVGLLTLAIGQIFGSVSRLTSVGTALAEVDGMARQMEARLREDFAALNRMGAENTYIAIRWREVGDLDRDTTADLGANEEEVYLTPEDEEADRKDRIARPYERRDLNTRQEVISRAVTTRVDEIAFLGLASPEKPYRSVQVQTAGANDDAPAARAARIYWGHALRPRVQRSSATPEREFVPDGDFGWGPREYGGAPRTYSTPLDNINGQNIPSASFTPSGRNKYAAQWTLARHTLLLYGGTATGVMDAVTGDLTAPIGRDREYAPYVSDIVSAFRFSPGAVISGVQPVRPGLGPLNSYQTNGLGDNRLISDPRPIGGGRVDICAQDELDVRSMAEGQAPGLTQVNMGPYTGQLYRAGWLGTPPIHFDQIFSTSNSSDPFVAPLWWRADPVATATPSVPWISTVPTANLVVYENALYQRTILAGTLQRLLVDTGRRGLLRTWPTSPPADPIDAPEDALMDLHAAFAPRCSRFEVAWSDGSTVIDPNGVDLNGDGQPDLLAGEMVWFDYSPVLRTNGTPVNFGGRALRRTYHDIYLGVSNAPQRIAFKSGNPLLDPLRPEVMPEFTGGSAGPAQKMIFQSSQTNPIFPMAYHRSVTHGAPDPEHEAFAIWGFRQPTSDGNWGGAWPKPRFIRIRATLHDAQFRLPGGKTFEWVFEIRPGAGAGGRL